MKHSQDLTRREFVSKTALATLGAVALATPGCRTWHGRSNKPKVAFVTANLVARVTGYRFELEHWGEQHKKTVAATDAAAWKSICKEIAATGFTAVEVWEAHASPEVMTSERCATWKAIMEDHGLKPVGYAGSLNPKTAEICQRLDIPFINGGIGDNTPAQATELCKSSGVRYNIENHPQKNAEEILKVIGGGNEWLGVCIDTGWLGTQAANVPDVIRACGPLVRHAHIKDIKAAGKHETCLLGTGVAQVALAMKALQAIPFSGCYAWEDEPEDRNPFDSAIPNRKWIEERIG